MKCLSIQRFAFCAIIFSLAGAIAVHATTTDLLLGFNDAAATTTAGQNDYIIDLGISPATLVSTAGSNGGSYTFTNIISASTFSSAYSSDPNYLSDVAVGIVSGNNTPGAEILFQTSPGGVAGLTTWSSANLSKFIAAITYAGSSTVGEYASALGVGGISTESGGFSQFVAISPTTPGGNPGGSVASNSGNPMGYLSSGVATMGAFESTGTGARNSSPTAWVQLGTFNINVSTHNVTFTLGNSPPAPTIGSVISSVTNGFSPLSVVFTNSASGTITNWVWNFGNGDIITNTTGASVTNIYTAGGDYTVTLTVYGPGGTSTLTLTNDIIASPKPKISKAFIANQFVLSGTNCPVGVEYRVLSSTNVALPLNNWKPIFTNTFLANGNFSYTNASTNLTSFFQLVSP